MSSDLFINLGMDISFKKYINNKNEFNFFTQVLKMLVFIYGEENIMDSYENKDVESFYYVLDKYSVGKYTIDKFYSDIEKFYTTSIRNNASKGLISNPYFNYVQEDLIDMLIAKYKDIKFDDKVFIKFRSLLFTRDNKNYEMRNYNELISEDPTYISDYFEAKVFSELNPIEFSYNRDNKLPIKVYEAFNLSAEEVNKLSHKELDVINTRIFNYFNLSPIMPNIEEKLIEATNKLKNKDVQDISKNKIMTKYIIFAIILLVAVIITIIISHLVIGA